MRRKTAALAVSKSAQISKLLGEGYEAKEIVARGFNPGLVYQVKSKNGHKTEIADRLANFQRMRDEVPARPVSLIVNGLEVTIANGTAEQVGRIAAALI